MGVTSTAAVGPRVNEPPGMDQEGAAPSSRMAGDSGSDV